MSGSGDEFTSTTSCSISSNFGSPKAMHQTLDSLGSKRLLTFDQTDKVEVHYLVVSTALHESLSIVRNWWVDIYRIPICESKK